MRGGPKDHSKVSGLHRRVVLSHCDRELREEVTIWGFGLVKFERS